MSGVARSLVPAALLAAAAVVLFTVRLAVPPRYMFDEVYHAYTAAQYVTGNADAYLWSTKAPREGVAYTWNHPPAGILLIASGILTLGDDPWGYRLPSALFGGIGIGLTYLLAWRLTGRGKVALLAALFLLADGLYFAQSRIAMLDIFATVFLLAAFIGFEEYLRAPAGNTLAPLGRTGLFLGLAITTKWSGAFAAACIGLAAIVLAVRGAPAGRTRRLGEIALALVALPAVVYLVAYVPFFLTGHDVAQFAELQERMLLYHARLDTSHASQSSLWMWIAGERPIWYAVDASNGTTASVYALANAFLYLGFLPAVAFVAWRWSREGRRGPALVLLLGFLGQWLPWALVSRATFLYYFLPAVPFGAIAVADSVAALVRRKGELRVFALGYAALVFSFFIVCYPLLAAVPLTERASEALTRIVVGR